MFAHNGTNGPESNTTTRTFRPVRQVAAPGAKCAVFDCILLSVRRVRCDAVACRRRCTSCVSRSRSSKRSSAVPSWRCVVCKRLVRGSNARSPAKRPRSTSTTTSVSSCATVRCWTHAPDPSTTCVSRPRPAQTTSTASRKSRSWSARPARKGSRRSPASPAASRPLVLDLFWPVAPSEPHHSPVAP